MLSWCELESAESCSGESSGWLARSRMAMKQEPPRDGQQEWGMQQSADVHAMKALKHSPSMGNMPDCAIGWSNGRQRRRKSDDFKAEQVGHPTTHSLDTAFASHADQTLTTIYVALRHRRSNQPLVYCCSSPYCRVR